MNVSPEIAANGYPDKFSPLKTAILLSLIMALAAGMLFTRVNAHYDGWLAYNEGWYSIVAENYADHSLYQPTNYKGQPDMNVPPLFSWLLYVSSSEFGRHEWAFRLVPIIMGLLCVAGGFFIGREMYGDSAGLVAALFLATSRIFVFTSRNVQTDSTFLCFCLWGFFFYLLFRRKGQGGALIASGALFGLAFLTKQFTAIFLAALLTAVLVDTAGRRPKISFSFAAAIFLLVAVPGHFYVYHLLHNPGLVFSSQRYGAITEAEIPSAAKFLSLIGQVADGLGPALCILAVTALIIAARSAFGVRRHDAAFDSGGHDAGAPEIAARHGDATSQSGVMPPHSKGASRTEALGQGKMISTHSGALFGPYIIFPGLFFFLFFLFVHKHNYYMLGMVPFAALDAGAFVSRLRAPAVRIVIIAAALVISVPAVFMALGVQKFSYDRFAAACEFLDSQPGHNVLVADDLLLSRYEPAIRYYCRKTPVITEYEWHKLHVGSSGLPVLCADLIPLSKGLNPFVAPKTPQSRPNAVKPREFILPGGGTYYYLGYHENTRYCGEPLQDFPRRIQGVSILGYVFHLTPHEPALNRLEQCQGGIIQVKHPPGAPMLGMAEACDVDSLVLVK